MFGAVLGNAISIFIIILTAATLFKSGVRVETAEAAAQALRPFAGARATPLFAAGLLSILIGRFGPAAFNHLRVLRGLWFRAGPQPPHT